MPTTVPTENPAKDVRRYLRHWGNPRFVEAQLQVRHAGLTRDQRRRKARTIALSILQGVEFLESAEPASLLTKPLPLFYAAENITKAVCMFNDAALESTEFRAHGLRGDRSRRYSIKNFECIIGSAGSDVWSRAFAQVNADMVKYGLVLDAESITYDQRQAYATAPLAPGTILKLGHLLRHLPELTRDVVLAEWGNPYVVRAVDIRISVFTGPPRSTEIQFSLSHDHDMATRTMIFNRESDLLRRYTRLRDRLNVIEYHQGPTADEVVLPGVRCDIFGRVYMDFARGRTVLSEFLIYLAALFILADVVRYQVDSWSRLIEDHPAEAILIERFLDLVPRKLPNIVLNELHREVFLFKVGD